MQAVVDDRDIHAAVKAGARDLVELRLSQGCDPNGRDSKGETPLRLAILNCHYEIVELLLSRGADPNLSQPSQLGYTPVFLCFDTVRSPGLSKDENILRIILERGGNPNIKKQGGDTPLKVVSREFKNFKIEHAELLLSFGADPNDKGGGFYGDTALHYAAWYGYKPMVQLLLAAGADLHPANNIGVTPLQMATGSNHKEVVATIRKWRVSMAILVLSELVIYHHFDVTSIIDLWEYLGEDFI